MQKHSSLFLFVCHLFTTPYDPFCLRRWCASLLLQLLVRRLLLLLLQLLVRRRRRAALIFRALARPSTTL